MALHETPQPDVVHFVETLISFSSLDSKYPTHTQKFVTRLAIRANATHRALPLQARSPAMTLISDVGRSGSA